MHTDVGKHHFVKAALAEVVSHLNRNDASVKIAISKATGATDPNAVEQWRLKLVAHFSAIEKQAVEEIPEPYAHYVSRFDGVGLFQSVLAKLFQDLPDLQGYGDLNASWVTTPVEQGIHALKGFFHEIYKDVHGQHRPLLQSVIEAWKDLQFERAPYPQGTPQPIPIADEDFTIA